MNIKKPKLLVFVFLMFILFGCTSKDLSTNNKEGSLPPYKEINFNQKAGINNVFAISINSKNQLALSQYDAGSILIMDQDGKLSGEYKDALYNKSLLAFNSSDSIFAISQSYIRDDKGEIHSIKRNRTALEKGIPVETMNKPFKPLENAKEDLSNEIFKKIRVDGKGNIYALKLNGEIEIFDENLNKSNILNEKQYKDFTLDEKDNIIVLYCDSKGSVIEYIDTKGYKTKWEKEYPLLQSPDFIYYNISKKALYGLVKGTIVVYDQTGNAVKELMDHKKLSVISVIYDIAVDSDEQIYLLAESGDKVVLFKYVNDKITGNETEEQKKLVVYIYNDMLSVYSNAARKFEYQHKDIKIDLKLHADIGYFQYAQKLNTEILTGKGPDIIGSFYPLREYAEKDLLVDLDEIIKNDKSFDINDYYENIINGCRQKGKLYAMPINYEVPCFVVNEKLMKEKNITLDNDYTFIDLYNVAKKLNSYNSSRKCYLLPQIIRDGVHCEYVLYNDIDYYIDWEKKNAKFNSEDFIDILKKYKEMREKYTSPDIDESDINPRKDNNSIDNILFIHMPVWGYDSVGILGKLYNGFKALPIPKGEHTGYRFFQSELASINSNSKYKDEAWEFIKLLLSEEVQSDFYDDNFLMNKNADKKKRDYYMEMQHKIKKSYCYFYTASDIEQVSDITQSLNKLNIDTDALYSILNEEIYNYIYNDRSAEETARIIQNKVELYLNE